MRASALTRWWRDVVWEQMMPLDTPLLAAAAGGPTAATLQCTSLQHTHTKDGMCQPRRWRLSSAATTSCPQ